MAVTSHQSGIRTQDLDVSSSDTLPPSCPIITIVDIFNKWLLELLIQRSFDKKCVGLLGLNPN